MCCLRCGVREGLEEQEEGVVRRWWQVEGQDDRYELLDEYDVTH